MHGSKFLRVALAALAATLSLAWAHGAPGASSDGLWRDVPVSAIASRGSIYIRPDVFRTAALDDARLLQIIDLAPHESAGGPGVVLSIPMPDGSFQRFEIYESPVMAKPLAQRYPEIRTFAGRGLDDKNAWIRLDRTPAGFHAQVRGSAGTVYVDPYQVTNGQIVGDEYISYFTHDYRLGADRRFECGVHERKDGEPRYSPAGGAQRVPTGDVLRTYRTAIATTGEYASFHGGTVPAALAAVVTALNRVTGIYQTELAIRLELIANNDQLIFTNAATDGYTNNDGVAMLGQNQTKIDSIIGPGNYDIGHVFSTGGGGVAGLGVVCRGGNKARGVTGLGSPIGDVFYVDFVSHEMGHQFGANHTFNGTAGSCGGINRNPATAYEPGSGSTIMAYAGICNSHNIANFSDDHFHTVSFDEIVAYTNFSFGSNCDAPTATGNLPPLVEAGPGFTVPIDTPLRLNGSGSDPDGDSLVYRWEQFDLGPGGSPNAPSGNAPLFRSYPAAPTSTRYLPNLTSILNDTLPLGERLPTYARNLRFRLTALDEQVGGGGVEYDEVLHTVTDQAGPFDITSQNIPTTWTPGTVETITWDVANTDAAPVNCGSVNILFSSDLGQNFTDALALFTANDGSEDIVVPNIQTNVGRVQVECSDNIFLDINNVNITVVEDPDPDFAINLDQDAIAVCAPDAGLVDVNVLSIGGFTGSVALATSGEPAGTTTSFSPNPLNAGGVSVLTVANTGAAAGGQTTVTVEGTGSTGTRSDSFSLDITPGLAAAPAPLAPAAGASGVDRNPTLTWSPVAGVDGFLVEIASDSGFGNVVYNQTEATTSHSVGLTLDFGAQYYWRVSAQNFCGDAQSVTSSFTVVNAPTTVCVLPGAAIADNGPALESSLTTSDSGTVANITVFVDISHANSGDLVLSLRNDSTGTSVGLMDQPGAPLFPTGCPTADVENTFDDTAAEAAEDVCNAFSPGIGLESRPDGLLADFDGETISGDWTLSARDAATGVTGTLNEWCVEISAGAAPVDTDGDGVADDQDNCTLVPNADQRDTNGDGYGNLCDADLNGDLLTNATDLGIFRTVFFSADPDADFDGNGVVNAADLGTLRLLFFAPPGPSGIAP